jgi:hypothetical protein
MLDVGFLAADKYRSTYTSKKWIDPLLLKEVGDMGITFLRLSYLSAKIIVAQI